jgi:hypothetical protein
MKLYAALDVSLAKIAVVCHWAVDGQCGVVRLADLASVWSGPLVPDRFRRRIWPAAAGRIAPRTAPG